MQFRRKKDMSLNEKKRNKQPLDIYSTEGISRSKSFAGLSHRRANSTDGKFIASTDNIIIEGVPNALQDNLSFGHSLTSSSARSFIHGLKRSSKPHKSPKPERTQLIFDAICRGLKENIFLAQNDISSSRAAFDSFSVSSSLSQGRLYELEKQMKAAERYMKKLEFHLFKLEELKEQYDVQQKMRDGIRTMGYAYILSSGKEKETALHSVRTGFKECTEIMCSYEKKLESLMGTFLFEMKGIQGFARICCGDIFEVVLKHGDQKWKSRGRVIKNGQQLWENKVILFKSLFNEPLYIKALEVRGLGKNVLLGNKYCETKDLFSAHPQQMTINLNPSGSLKLNLVITWNPLHNVSDGIQLSSLSSLGGLPYTLGRTSASQSSISEGDISEPSLCAKDGIHQDLNTYESGCDNTSASISAISSAIISTDLDATVKSQGTDCFGDSELLSCETASSMPSNYLRLHDSNCNESQTFSIPPSENSSECCSVDMQSSSVHSQFSGHSLTETLKNLLSILEGLSGQYPEVDELLCKVTDVDKFLKEKRCSSSDSNISISIESALGCFDFLNSAIDNDDSENEDDKDFTDISGKECETSISCDVQVPENNELYTCSYDSLRFCLTSGIEQIDVVLTVHLIHCTKLVNNLGSCGPLKCLEVFTLDKIKKQSLCIFSILKLLERKPFDVHLDDFFDENEGDVKQIWISTVGDVVCVAADHLSNEMEKYIQSKVVLDNYLANQVSSHLVCQVLDINQFEQDSAIVTVLQFKAFFLNCQGNSSSVILDLVTEAMASENLKHRDVQNACSAAAMLSKIVPSSRTLHLISSLLTDENRQLKTVAENYLVDISEDSFKKEKAIQSYLEGLDSESVPVRLGSCVALGVLNEKSCSNQLSYVSDTDENDIVREVAKCVLMKFEEAVANDPCS